MKILNYINCYTEHWPFTLWESAILVSGSMSVCLWVCWLLESRRSMTGWLGIWLMVVCSLLVAVDCGLL